MALINCPECGKEISDKAVNCICCGFPLNLMEDNFSNQDIEGKKYIAIFIDNWYIKIDSGKFYQVSKSYDGSWKGLDKGDKYHIEENIIVREDNNSRSNRFVIDGDYIFSFNDIMENEVPQKNYFNGEFLNIYNGMLWKKHVFRENGTYDLVSSSGYVEETGKYVRNGNIITTIIDSFNPKHFPPKLNSMYVYQNRLVRQAYVWEEKYSEFKKNVPEIEWKDEREEICKQMADISMVYKKSNAPWDTQYFDYPCPYCGKYKVRYAKWEDKQMSTAFWGVFSRKLHCNYKCDSCREMWE